jgi:DNA repair protein RAD16
MGDSFEKLDSFLSGSGAKSSRSGASLLPTPVSPAWYNAESKAWYGEKDLSGIGKKEKNGLVQCSLFVQYSPTARARCRRCGDNIEKDVLRLGYPFRWRAAEDAYSLYLHPECYVPEVFGIKEKELPKKVLGYSALSNTEKAKLWKAMRSSGKDKAAGSEGKAAAKDYSTKSVLSIDKVPPVKVPKQITIPMLPFQQEGLAWMCHQETQAARGGILADEMGMGKTIQMIALLCARKLDGPALVVVPMAAVTQWCSEIHRFTSKNALTTMVYHGAQRSKLLSDFKKVDVVVTTYQTLESDYRREANKNRVPCKWCKKLFLPEKLAFHQKYFCGPDAVRTLKQQKTQRKDKDAALKGMATMGIGQQASSSSHYAPPTITNIYKDYMKQAGHDIKASGYWNVRREAAALAKSREGSTSSSSKPPKNEGDDLSRERLAILDRQDLQALCKVRGLEQTGTKPALIDRLKDFEVEGMAKKQGLVPKTVASGKMGARLIAAAKAKVKAKAKAANKLGDAPLITPAQLIRQGGSSSSSKYQGVSWVNDKWQASHCGKYLGRFDSELKAARAICQHVNGYVATDTSKKGKKPSIPTICPPCGSARTVGNQRAAALAAGSSSKGKAASSSSQGKGIKRTHEETETQKQYVTYEGAQLDMSGSPLHAMTWSRIILDEAHRIKGRTNSTALAAYALKADCFKWCITGTPLQNRVGELYALIRFLRIRPFAFYYCKKAGCMCECARFMRDRYCPNCGHVRFMHFSHFKSKVSNPIIKYGYMGAGKEAFNTLRHDILGKTMLRRTKEERKKDLKLPPIKVMIRKDALSKQEADFYHSLYMQSCVKFDTYIQGGTILHNYAHIFDLLTSLRRAVDHPYLIVYGGGASSHKLPGGVKMQPKLGSVCGLCQDDVLEDGEEVKRTAKCGHCFHDECIRDYIADAPKLKGGGVGCPVCFTKLSIDLGDDNAGSDDEGGKARKQATSTPPRKRLRDTTLTPPKSSAPEKSTPPKQKGSGIMQKVRASEFQSSTKVEALLEEVHKMMKADKGNKAIVFSQFGAMLDIVEFRLKRAGISCVVFRGGMTMQARDDALKAFNNDASLKVILISLKAGGEGLNLQVANHVFLLDPWWNPACEMQAIQRAHRIGQTRDVKAIRFVTKNTIEEKILGLQAKKQLVFDASIDGSAASMVKLTEQDLRFLFQH